MKPLALVLGYCAVAACTPCGRLQCGAAVVVVVGTQERPVNPDIAYVVELDLDGQSVRVDCEFEGACEIDAGVGPYSTSATRSGASLNLDIFDAGHGGPEFIGVSIVGDGETVFAESLSPDYRDVPRESNDACGVCRSSVEPFFLPGS